MLCKVFVYEDLDNESYIYLNGPDHSDPDKLLELYVNWYNKDFAPDEDLSLRHKHSFNYIRSFCPIDFYDDYKKEVDNEL